ncbi:MAG: hypothetical protein GTO02_07900 [Candidatus Dadabacteria bacterium]|nr:hypothetical protein [Candidatus Dadabacteria bacterium]
MDLHEVIDKIKKLKQDEYAFFDECLHSDLANTMIPKSLMYCNTMANYDLVISMLENVCSNEQTNTLKLSTRRDNNE